jgi:hypothetical protein
MRQSVSFDRPQSLNRIRSSKKAIFPMAKLALVFILGAACSSQSQGAGSAKGGASGAVSSGGKASTAGAVLVAQVDIAEAAE